jgi:glycosyltransferase involved in cell wall biosynthesis
VRTLVVLPTYDEAGNITAVLRAVRASAPQADVLVVDDASPDGTADLAEEAAAELGQVKVLRRAGKQGLGRAYCAGFAVGLAEGYEILIEMDADLSHDPAVLPSLITAVEHGADLAIGSRYVPGGAIPDWSWHRKALSRWGNRYAAAVLGLGVNDATSGFRAYRAGTLRGIDLDSVRSDGYGFQIELTFKAVRKGAKVWEIPIAFVDRREGESKMSGRIVTEALAHVTRWGIQDVLTLRRFRRT